MKTLDEAICIMSCGAKPDPVVMQGITEVGIDVVRSSRAQHLIFALIGCYRKDPEIGEFPLLAFGLSCFASGVRVGMEMEKVDL